MYIEKLEFRIQGITNIDILKFVLNVYKFTFVGLSS